MITYVPMFDIVSVETGGFVVNKLRGSFNSIPVHVCNTLSEALAFLEQRMFTEAMETFKG